MTGIKPYYETELGKLYHGCCLKILPQLEPVDLVFTDPPYNAKKDYGEFKDNLSKKEYARFMWKVAKLCLKLSPKQAWVAPRYQNRLFLNIFRNSHIVVVRRGARGPFRGGWSDQFEIILITGKPNQCAVDLWDGIRLKGEGYFFRENTYGHPGYTPRPIIERCINLMTCPNDIVLDCFSGTGTLAVVCEDLGRRWICIEQEEKWVEIAAKRIERESKQLKFKGF